MVVNRFSPQAANLCKINCHKKEFEHIRNLRNEYLACKAHSAALLFTAGHTSVEGVHGACRRPIFWCVS